jgi:hypothetical protein
MARLVGFSGQKVLTTGFRADGTAGTAPTLILPNAAPRSSVLIQNVSDTQMWFEFGCARATATVTSGVVTSCTITNAGFNFTYAPRVLFLGGGHDGNGRNLGVGYPEQNAPSNVATGHCVMTGSAGNLSVASITIDNGGSGYTIAPYVLLVNDPNDAFGCADPSASSGTGFTLYPGQWLDKATHHIVPTDAIAVYCSSNSKKYFCEYTV